MEVVLPRSIEMQSTVSCYFQLISAPKEVQSFFSLYVCLSAIQSEWTTP